MSALNGDKARIYRKRKQRHSKRAQPGVVEEIEPHGGGCGFGGGGG
jgi:hypothetical protein